MLWVGQSHVLPSNNPFSCGQQLVRGAWRSLKSLASEEDRPDSATFGLLFVADGFEGYKQLLNGIQSEFHRLGGKATTNTRKRFSPIVPIAGCTTPRVIVNGEVHSEGAGLCLWASSKMIAKTVCVDSDPDRGLLQKDYQSALKKCEAWRLIETRKSGFLMAFFPSPHGATGQDSHQAFDILVRSLPGSFPIFGTSAESTRLENSLQKPSTSKNKKALGDAPGPSSCFSELGPTNKTVIVSIETDFDIALTVDQAFSSQQEVMTPTLFLEPGKEPNTSRYLERLGKHSPSDFCDQDTRRGSLVAIPIEKDRSALTRPHLVIKQDTSGQDVELLDVHYDVRPEWGICRARVGKIDFERAAARAARQIKKQLAFSEGLFGIPIVFSCRGKLALLSESERDEAVRLECCSIIHETPGALLPFGAYVGGEFGYHPPDNWPANYSLGILFVTGRLSRETVQKKNVENLVQAVTVFSRVGVMRPTQSELIDSFFDVLRNTIVDGGLVRFPVPSSSGYVSLVPSNVRTATVGPGQYDYSPIGDTASHPSAQVYRGEEKELLFPNKPGDDGPARIAMPLASRSGRAPLGVLELVLKPGVEPSADYLHVLRELSDSLSFFLSIQSREEMLNKAVGQLKSVAQRTQTAAQLERLLEEVAESACKLTDSTYVTIRMLKEPPKKGKSNFLHFRAGYQAPGKGVPDLLRQANIRTPFWVAPSMDDLDRAEGPKRNASAKVILTGIYHLHNRIQEDRFAFKVAPEINAHLLMPLSFANETMGVLNCNQTGGAVYDDKDVYLLNLFANEVSMAIQLAVLSVHHTAVKEISQAFVYEDRQAGTLPDFARTSVARNGLPRVVDILTKAVGAEGGIAFVAHPGMRAHFHKLYTCGCLAPEVDVEEVWKSQGQGFPHDCFHGKTRITIRERADYDFAGFCFFESGPFLAGGMLIFQKSQPGFDYHDAELLTAIQYAITSGFRHANAVDRLHQNLLQKKNLIAAQTHQVVRPIRYAIRELDAVTARTPELEKALQNYKRFDEIVTQMLNLQRYERSAPETWEREEYVETIFLEAINRCRAACEEREVIPAFKVDSQLRVHCDKLLLVEVVSNLLDNAIKFSKKGGRIELEARVVPAASSVEANRACPLPLADQVASVSQWSDGIAIRRGLSYEVKEKSNLPSKVVLLQIKDEGEGVEFDSVSKIFQFGDSKKPEHGEVDTGWGLGLFLVLEVVELHQGGIFVRPRSEGGPKGATFTIALPA